jgi:sugar/nucleoside kinase (ribokinase family)
MSVVGSLPGRSRSTPSVLVAGLRVVDLVQRVKAPPGPDEKVTALAAEMAAGGPATNGAVTVAVLGGEAVLVTAVGSSPLQAVVRADLDRSRLSVVDIAADDPHFALNVSSVVVVDGTGERSVVSMDAGTVDEASAALVARASVADTGPDVVLLDGHYPAVASAVAAEAGTRRIPVVLDAGRWKPHFADLLPLVDEVVCSSAFKVPAGSAFGDIASFGHAAGARVVAQTHGADVIQLSVEGLLTTIEVPSVEAVDTLGAGDVLHGAYAFHRAVGREPQDALRRAAEVASFRCRFVGSRTWVDAWPDR